MTDVRAEESPIEMIPAGTERYYLALRILYGLPQWSPEAADFVRYLESAIDYSAKVTRSWVPAPS